MGLLCPNEAGGYLNQAVLWLKDARGRTLREYYNWFRLLFLCRNVKRYVKRACAND